MAHVDLSLSDLYDPSGLAGTQGLAGQGSFDLWASAAGVASEPCVLIDVAGNVVAASPGCGNLFGIRAADATGRRLVDGVLRLLDFNTISGELPGWEVDKIPPLLAMTTGGLARGLLRVPGSDGLPMTVDAISVAIREGVEVVGSLTFFARVNR